MSEWKELKLGEVLKINYGKDHKKLADGNIPLYGSGGIMRYVEKSLFDDESILIPRKGTLSNLFYTQGPIWVVDTIFWTKINKDIILPRFLFYQLRTKDFTLLNVGAAVPSLTTQVLNEVDIFLPPLPTQQRIASILSAYDDLIENNLKRIKLLEEIAQRTYEEWFVKFRINGVKLEVGENGLPEGWERKKLGDLCEKITDGTHDSPKPVDEGYKLITGKHLINGDIDFESAYNISYQDHLKIQKRSGVLKNDVLFSNIGTLGNVAIVREGFEYSCKNMIIFRPLKNYEYFFYSYLINSKNKERFLSQSSGSTQKFISLNFIRNFEDNLPTSQFIEKFNSIISYNFFQINNLQNQNRLLKESRDILLPRLMSGKVGV
jgi:type I restriction enzyme S subunit